jgi:hypothetical protein
MQTDGNEADSESPWHQRRAPSALGGRKPGMRAISRLGESDAAAAADGKPKWRP